MPLHWAWARSEKAGLGSEVVTGYLINPKCAFEDASMAGKIVRLVLKLLILILAAIGLVNVAGSALSRIRPKFSDPGASELLSTLSPDGAYKAILFNENGGGGISPYCVDTIVVAAASKTVRRVDDASMVFQAACMTFRDPTTNNRTNGPTIDWISSRQLRITFSPTQGSAGVDELLRGYADGGQVRIVYDSRD
jgi:hypothetical protein